MRALRSYGTSCRNSHPYLSKKKACQPSPGTTINYCVSWCLVYVWDKFSAGSLEKCKFCLYPYFIFFRLPFFGSLLFPPFRVSSYFGRIFFFWMFPKGFDIYLWGEVIVNTQIYYGCIIDDGMFFTLPYMSINTL